MGIPLRPDPTALRAAARRSYTRAIAAQVMSYGSNERTPEEVVRRNWRDDREAALLVKSPVSPTKTSDYLQATVVRVLAMLAPLAASSRLLELATSIDLSGIHSIRIPFIGAAGRPGVPFVAEGDPGNAVNLTTSAATLGPVRKLMVLSSVTRETQEGSAETALKIVSDALEASIAGSIDGALSSTNAATAIASPGLLSGLTPITASTAGGVEAVAEDLGHLAETIALAGINPDNMVVITLPYLMRVAQTLALRLPEMMSSPTLTGGQVIAIVPEGLAVGTDSGAVAIDLSPAAEIHFEDTTPAEIVSTPGAVAAPVRSAFQTDLIVVRLRASATWIVHPGAVAFMTGAAW
jgi:hypothetical protein